ncbi:MAG: hypothetical protein PHQ74_10455 [Crocinitomicaceae bacterium]|nr:hypothetical protein [Crocinitomicaceae bacterium]
MKIQNIKKLPILLLFLWINLDLNAQLTDVFTNTVYSSVSTRVIKKENKMDYISGELEFYQDHLNHENFSDALFEKIQNVAVQNITDKLYFQIVFNELLEKINRNNQIFSDNGEEIEYENPKFQNLEIKLVSILNNQAIFSFNYDFEVFNYSNRNRPETFSIQRYYHVDLKTEKVERFNPYLSNYATVFPKIVLDKLNRLYAISTKKIELNKLEDSIPRNHFDGFLSRLKIEEAKLIPYFAGAIIVFDAYSESSKNFRGQAFQVYLNYDELKTFSNLLPYYKSFYGNFKNDSKVNPLLAEIEEKVKKFGQDPSTLDFIDSTSKINNLEIELYQQDDKLYRTERYEFDESGKLILNTILNVGDKNHSQKIYSYFENGNLKSIASVNTKKELDELQFYYYKNGKAQNQENIQQQIVDYDNYNNQNSNSKSLEAEFNQEFYFYNKDYQYTFRMDAFKEVSREHITISFISGNEYCNGWRCLVLDDKLHVIGIKSSKHPMHAAQALTNNQGQVTEYFYDNDRRIRYYTYDDLYRITSIKKFSDSKLETQISYEYENDGKIPSVVIYKTDNGSRKNVYKVE